MLLVLGFEAHVDARCGDTTLTTSPTAERALPVSPRRQLLSRRGRGRRCGVLASCTVALASPPASPLPTPRSKASLSSSEARICKQYVFAESPLRALLYKEPSSRASLALSLVLYPAAAARQVPRRTMPGRPLWLARFAPSGRQKAVALHSIQERRASRAAQCQCGAPLN